MGLRHSSWLGVSWVVMGLLRGLSSTWADGKPQRPSCVARCASARSKAWKDLCFKVLAGNSPQRYGQETARHFAMTHVPKTTANHMERRPTKSSRDFLGGTFQIRMVPSSCAVAIKCPSGLNLAWEQF